MSEATSTEVKVTGGIGMFFFALIPGALAGAALMWLAFFTGLIDWQKIQRVEGRMDNRVGVNGELTKPVDLIILKKSCLIIDRAYLDGETGTMYTTNKCNGELRYVAWHWNIIAPDGTVLKTDYANSLDGQFPDMKMEKTFNLPDDPRVAKVVVWTEATLK
jgi:hypothetical protein